MYNETDYEFNKKTFEERFEKFNFFNIANMDDLIYVKFINEKIGYGVFANKFLPKNTIIGEYTGVITLKKN